MTIQKNHAVLTNTLRNDQESRVFMNAADLRSYAEQKLAERSLKGKKAPIDEQRLLHELLVHQIELEAVIETLHQTQDELAASQARYFDLYDLAPVGYLTVNQQDRILEANLTASQLLGVPHQALLSQSLSHFIAFKDQDNYYLSRKALSESGEAQSCELNFKKPNGTHFCVRLEMNRTLAVDGEQTFRIVISDVSREKASDQYLRQAAAMFETAREGVMVTDADMRILVVNRAFSELTGYTADEVLGQTPHILKSGRQNQAFYLDMWEQINNSGYWQGEIWNRRKDGEIYPQMLSISAVLGDNNQVTHYVGVFSDISQLKDAVARLEFLAHHDALTSLPNRLLLFARLEHCIGMSRRERKSAALLMLDLDRFKDVNDSFGHLAGDELLQQVAAKLSCRLRGIDTVTRLGGDEFAILLEDLAHPQDAALVAAEIIESLSEPWRLSNGSEVRVGVSIGISLLPEHGASSEELLQHADAALYRAKAEGRGNFKYFSEDLTQAALRRINLESLLRRALLRQEFVVYYQPQIEISTGQIIGAEALLRWHNAEEGAIPPSQFIPVAEEIGLISEIGEWVLSEVCRQGKSWLAAGLPPIKLAVNLSPHQIRHGDIAASTAAILSQTGFPPELLELELTESALMERETEVVLVLSRLQALGVRLAIDDFGTGYSSLAYLKHFPLDILKIDKTFIDDIPQLEDDKEIASAIIGMGHTLRLKVLAEGVETQEQLDFLTEHGCDFYQGYLKSPALAANDFAALLQSQV